MQPDIEIYALLKDFYKISGIRVSIHDTEFNEIYSYPDSLCTYCKCIQENPSIKKICLEEDAHAFNMAKSTGKTYLYKCKRGLFEAAAPIYHYGILSGYIMMGQIRSEGKQALSTLEKNAYEILRNAQKATEISKTVHIVENEKLNSYINLITALAQYLTGLNKLHAQGERLPSLIYEYLNRNYASKITLEALSQKFGYCKSTLINSFKNEYRSSIMETLTKIRLNHAVSDIKHSNKSLKEIAADCGFYDQNHFSKVFLRRYGCTPREYRFKA